MLECVILFLYCLFESTSNTITSRCMKKSEIFRCSFNDITTLVYQCWNQALCSENASFAFHMCGLFYL
jgi:hypothetical protein